MTFIASGWGFDGPSTWERASGPSYSSLHSKYNLQLNMEKRMFGTGKFVADKNVHVVVTLLCRLA